MKTKDLEKYAEKIKKERGFNSLVIIGTHGNVAISQKLGSPYEMLMGLLSTYNDVLEETGVKELIKNGEIKDEKGVWGKILEINNSIKELGIK